MKWFSVFFLQLSLMSVSAHVSTTPEAIQDSLLKQLAFFPQEKMHLHTDRSQYVPGEGLTDDGKILRKVEKIEVR